MSELLCNYRGRGGVWNFDVSILRNETLFQALAIKIYVRILGSQDLKSTSNSLYWWPDDDLLTGRNM